MDYKQQKINFLRGGGERTALRRRKTMLLGCFSAGSKYCKRDLFLSLFGDKRCEILGQKDVDSVDNLVYNFIFQA